MKFDTVYGERVRTECLRNHRWVLIEETEKREDVGTPGERGFHTRLIGRRRRFYCKRCRAIVVDEDRVVP